MPSGRTHDRITLWSLPWVVGGSFLLARDGELTLLVSGTYLFSGLMFGPDLDIYSVQFKRWGPLRWLWLPYQKCIGHRSRLSHGAIVGTVLRVLYLGAWLVFFAAIALFAARALWDISWDWQQIGERSWLWLVEYRWQLLAAAIGLELGAMSHAIADSLSTTRKRVRRQGLKALFPARKPPRRKKRSRSASRGRRRR